MNCWVGCKICDTGEVEEAEEAAGVTCSSIN